MIELTNLSNHSSFLAVFNKVYNREIVDEDTYAEAIESIELQNCKQTSETVEACIDTAGWDPRLDEFRKFRNMPFAEYYDLQQCTGHTALYKKEFHLIKPRRKQGRSFKVLGTNQSRRKRSKRSASSSRASSQQGRTF